MSYQVLARKYRPKNFETLVGQEHVVRALTHALQSGRLHHAYLFTGTRGVGKTTLSRILAKSLNCIGVDGNGGITAQPCGLCDACTAIDAGRFVDYIEMDAASNRGVDEMAQLLEQAVYAPSNARFKVYMIDEVHMLTNHAFNSMLKTLEEPPDHVKFILATTDPQKIPVTVLSRCLQFNLKQMPPGHIIDHLDNILGQEGISFESPALRLLAQGAHGSMRDALSLTDQAIAYAAGEVTLAGVQGMLGALDQTYLVRLLDALAQQNGADLLAVADEMAARSLSYSGALQDLGTLLHRVALAQTVPAALPADLPEVADIVRLGAAFSAEEVQLYYQIVVHGRNELGLAPDEYAGFTMTLLRMLAFRPGNGGAEGVAPPSVSAAKPVLAAAPAARAAAPQPAPKAGASAAPSHVSVTALTPAPSVAAAQATRPAMAAGSARAAALAAAGAGGRMQAGSARPMAPSPVASAPAVAPPAVAATKKPAPWEDDVPPVVPAPVAPAQPVEVENALPAWVVEFSDDTALVHKPASVPAIVVETVSTIAPTIAPTIETAAGGAADAPAPSYVPVPGLGWDGNWPVLATGLPLRGIAQQLALQTELITCLHDEQRTLFRLCVPIETWRSSANLEKLAAALSDHFKRKVSVETELGPVRDTASAQAQVHRAGRQRDAEATIENDPFVQSMMRDLGATVVPGSITPAALAQ
ncbi:MAG: DNA polymerase-3 subunit gamma/tau [Janthinobacterium sp.]|jgi:DNA polymerase-3 subunit gamma/tau